jgi:hypothetical protein
MNESMDDFMGGSRFDEMKLPLKRQGATARRQKPK